MAQEEHHRFGILDIFFQKASYLSLESNFQKVGTGFWKLL